MVYITRSQERSKIMLRSADLVGKIYFIFILVIPEGHPQIPGIASMMRCAYEYGNE